MMLKPLSSNFPVRHITPAGIHRMKMSTTALIIILLFGAAAGQPECLTEKFCDKCIVRPGCVFVFAKKAHESNSSRFFCTNVAQVKNLFPSFRQLSNPLQCPRSLRGTLKDTNVISNTSGDFDKSFTTLKAPNPSSSVHDPGFSLAASSGNIITPIKIHALTFATAAPLAALPFCPSFLALLTVLLVYMIFVGFAECIHCPCTRDRIRREEAFLDLAERYERNG